MLFLEVSSQKLVSRVEIFFETPKLLDGSYFDVMEGWPGLAPELLGGELGCNYHSAWAPTSCLAGPS